MFFLSLSSEAVPGFHYGVDENFWENWSQFSINFPRFAADLIEVHGSKNNLGWSSNFEYQDSILNALLDEDHLP